MNKLIIRFLNIYNKYIHKFVINEKDDRQKKILGSLYIIFTLVTISILIIFAIKPALSTVSSLQQQLQDSRHVEQAMRAKIQALSSLDIQYTELESALPHILEAIPKTAEIATATRQIELLTSHDQLSLGALTINNFQLFPPVVSPIASLTFNISVHGSSDNINHFIQDISSIERLVTLDSISKSRNDEKSDTQASLVGRIYYFNK